MKEKFCKKYFENTVKPKHLREFEAETPNGNVIKGYISRKPNKYLGSLVITHIKEKNGESYETEQFVQSFPKIHYWGLRHKLDDQSTHIFYHCQEKLDGTCLILYVLKDKYGKSIEIIPKTRGKAVADDHIVDMYNLVDKKAVCEFFSIPHNINSSLMFELYGMLNRHEIAHMGTYIDMKLIGAYIDGEFLDYDEIKMADDLNGFNVPETIFGIIKYPGDSNFLVHWYGFESKFKNYEILPEDTFPTLYDAIQKVKLLLEQLNKEYLKYNNRMAIEGVVINGRHFKGQQMYLKIKPANVEAEIKNMASIPRRFILKEINKYFDEYGSNVREIYEKDENHHLNYVKMQLKEEFDYEQINDVRTLRRIKKVFMDVWDSRIPPKSLQNICEELVEHYPDKNISELMKIFAKENPTKKRQSRYVYNILSKMLSKQV